MKSFPNSHSPKSSILPYADKESFKVTQMCTQPDFLISDGSEETENKRSRLKPVFLTVEAKYKGGEVTANIKISGLYAVRQPFIYTDVGEKGSVPAYEQDYLNAYKQDKIAQEYAPTHALMYSAHARFFCDYFSIPQHLL